MGLVFVILLLGVAVWRGAVWRRRGKPDSLRWAFARYILCCVAAAVGLCSAALWGIGNITGSLEHRYASMLNKEFYVPVTLVTDDGTAIGRQYIGFDSSYDYTDLMSPGEARVYTLLTDSFFSVCLYTGICAVCIAVTSALFYRRRLKVPLETLDKAAGRIAAGDLDFTVTVAGSDELARLGSSFETMRAALAEANRTLWRTLEDERRVQAAFAHDLRTPLTVLRGYDEFLLKYADTVPPAKLRETLGTMHGNLVRLENYTARMGRARKLEALDLHRAPVDLAALCTELAAEGKALCAGAGKTFVLTGCGGRFALDEDVFREVYGNLVSNAARHAAGTVRAVLTTGGDVLTLTVADDGPGFSAAALAHAADAFWRGGDAPDAARSEHSGLGLYICRVLCQKHGGGLTLANGEGGGAEVGAAFGAGPLDMGSGVC